MNPANPSLSARDRRRNRVITMVLLVGVWVLLWGRLSWGNLIGGLVVAAIVVTFFPLPPVTFAGRIRPVRLLRFVGRFVSDLVVASTQVAWLAFRFGQEPRSAVIGVPLRVASDLNLTLVAELLSLIPGSLIVEVDRTAGTLYVHVLNVSSAGQARTHRRQVLEVETRLIRAIGSAAEVERVAQPLPRDIELRHDWPKETSP